MRVLDSLKRRGAPPRLAIALSFFAALSCTPSRAEFIHVDFEDATQSGGTVYSRGVSFRTGFASYAPAIVKPADGSGHVRNHTKFIKPAGSAASSTIVIDPGSEPFTLQGFDVAEAFYYGYHADQLAIVGAHPDGSTELAFFDIDGVYGGAIADEWQQVWLSSAFSNLDYVRLLGFVGGSQSSLGLYSVDNIDLIVGDVPEPSTLLLLALGGLALFVRRNRFDVGWWAKDGWFGRVDRRLCTWESSNASTSLHRFHGGVPSGGTRVRGKHHHRPPLTAARYPRSDRSPIDRERRAAGL